MKLIILFVVYILIMFAVDRFLGMNGSCYGEEE